MEQQKIISIMLSLGADKQSIQNAIAAFGKIQKELVELEKEADDLKRKISIALYEKKDTSDLDTQLKLVQATIRQVSKTAQNELGKGFTNSIEKATAATEKLYKEQRRLGQESYNLRDIGEKLNQLGMGLQNAGDSLINPIRGAISAYLQTAPIYDKSAQRWNAAQKEMQESYNKIGSVAVKELLPLIESVAKLTTQIADLLEKYPGLITVALGAGGIAKVLGGGLSFAAQMLMMKGAMSALTGGTAGGALLGPASTTVGATIAGLGPGVGLGVGAVTLPLIAAALGNELLSYIGGPNARTNQVLTVGAYKAGNLFGNIAGLDEKEIERKSTVFAAIIGRITGAIDKNSPLWDKAISSLPETKTGTASFARDNVQLYIDYEKQKKEATQQYAQESARIEREAANQRVQIIQSFKDRAAQAETAYRSENSRAAAEYQRTQAQASADYYRQRAEAEASYQTDMQRMAEDHKRALAQLEEDHNGRVRDLVADRDALGLIKENESYARERGRLESDYGVEAKRKREDFARQMADLQANFEAQRAQRAQEYAAQQQERAQRFAQEMEQLQKEKDQQLAEVEKSRQEQLSTLEEGYNQQMQVIESSFTDSLNRLIGAMQTNANNLASWATQYVGEFDAYLKSKNFKVDGQRALGGPVLNGRTYLVGERGPELFTAPRDGSIVPAGLTAALLNPRQAMGGGGRNMTLKIESSTLTMTEIVSEMDRRFNHFERMIGDAFAT